MAISPLNTTVTAANYTMKTFYERDLLEVAETICVHQQFGKPVSIAKRQGNRIEWRKSNLYTPSTTDLLLTEGVTPTGETYSQSQVLAQLYTYGNFVALTTELNDTSLDNLVDENNHLLSIQLSTTLDWVCRDAIISEATAQYAGSNINMLGVDKTDLITVDEFRKAVTFLEKAKAPKFTAPGQPPHYVAIIDPDVKYDLQDDDKWQKPNEYGQLTPLYTGEIGMLYGVRFVNSTEGYKSVQSVNNLVNGTVTSDALVLKNTPTAAELAYLSVVGNKVKIGSSVSGATERTIVSYAAGTKTLTLTDSTTYSANDLIFSEDAGTVQTDGEGVTIHHSLVLGKDAFGVIKLDGEGTLVSIIKPKGSAGSEDPLDQRSTVAVKAPYYAVKSLYPLYTVDIMSAATGTNP